MKPELKLCGEEAAIHKKNLREELMSLLCSQKPEPREQQAFINETAPVK